MYFSRVFKKVAYGFELRISRWGLLWKQAMEISYHSSQPAPPKVANNIDFIVCFQWLQEKQLILFVHWKWIAVNIFLHALFSHMHCFPTYIYICLTCISSLTFQTKKYLLFFLKFIIDNLYRSQKLHMLSIYRGENNFGKYTVSDELFFFCHRKSLTVEGYFLMEKGEGGRQPFRSCHIFFFPWKKIN